MARVSILLADDHEIVREGLKTILGADPSLHVVAETGDGRNAVAQATALQPDVVLMDVSLPMVNGLHATAAIRQGSPRTHVIVFTRHADQGYVRRLFQAGATGYVLKRSRAADLLRAIHVVASGGTYLDPAVAPYLGYARDGHTTPAPRRGPAGELSPREEEVLRLVAWGHSNKAVAAQLGLSVKTVETHKANVAQKLGLRGRIDILRFAMRRGWLEGLSQS
jgi:DNA-binding NarL/FixJ family response regulator